MLDLLALLKLLLTHPNSVIIVRDKLYLLTANIEYYGKTTAEYLLIRKIEAEGILSRRLSGEMNGVIYKNIAERVKQFSGNLENPVDFDLLTFEVPLANGANFKLTRKL